MPTVQILLGGVDLTDKVVYATASFESKVNGQPGQGKMRVRDDDSTFTFTTGADWLVLVDGEAAWRGFAMQRKLVYIAPAMDVADSGLQRFVDVWGPDGNILFDRRFVASASSPATVEGTQFPAATADTTAIADLIANWLDLSADSIDTSSGVNHVGNLDPAQKTRAWSGGWTWGNAMNTIAMLPGAIYYNRPESGSPHFTLCYCDVDIPTSPFGLSDQPNGTTTRGYREMEITRDATGMVNDEMAWGMGYGSQIPVFKRLISTSSVTAHGLWQDGQQASSVYKQSTIDRIADSIVNGSPSNRRGAKNDRVAVELVTYEPGLLAGHVVAFDSQVWGFSDTIPVRDSTLTFEAPDLPRWKLLLSHEIDTPWGFYDQFWRQIPTWPLPCLIPPCQPLPPTQPSSPCDCGITDSFARVLPSDWGTADCGLTWVSFGSGQSVSDPYGVIEGLDGAVSLPTGALDPFILNVTVTMDWPSSGGMGAGTSNSLDGILVNTADGPPGTDTKGYIEILRTPNPGGSDFLSVFGDSFSTTNMGAGAIVNGHPYTLQIQYRGGILYAFLIDYEVVPAVTLGATSAPLAAWLWDSFAFRFEGSIGTASTSFNWLGINGVDRCAVYCLTHDCSAPDHPCYEDCSGGLDDPFDRTATGAWDNGWAVLDGSLTIGVDGTSGWIETENGSDTTVEDMGHSLLLAPFMDATLDFTLSTLPFGVVSLTLSDPSILAVAKADLQVFSGTACELNLAHNSDNVYASVTLDATQPTRIEMGISGGLLTARAWNTSGGAPAWQVSIASGEMDASLVTVSVSNFGSASPCTFYADEVVVNAGCAPVDPIPVGPPVGPTGYGCEVPTRTSSTVYATSSQFTPGSILVWRAGLLQRPVTDYAEDAGSASITFTTAVASGEEVRVCYLAQVQP